jgi:hypothetical protein
MHAKGLLRRGKNDRYVCHGLNSGVSKPSISGKSRTLVRLSYQNTCFCIANLYHGLRVVGIQHRIAFATDVRLPSDKIDAYA